MKSYISIRGHLLKRARKWARRPLEVRIMVNLRVVNWRCIENLELQLAKINIFVGKNSTGKSSLAYATYFASKSRSVDPQYLLTQLYGCGFDKVARLVEDRPQFPITVGIDGSEFSVKPSELIKIPKLPGETERPKDVRQTAEFEITKPSSSPWVDEFLLPSRRVNFIQIIMLLPKIVGELRTKPQSALIQSFIGGLFELFKSLPLFPPFGMFALDYTRALTGIQLESASGEIKDAGSYVVNIHPLFSLIELTVQDPYINLQLPAELAPDGLLDFSIFDSMTQKIPKNSLVVIEEPEIHKNPLMVIEFTERITKRVLDKDITLIMTTHSDIPLITIGKLVAEKVLRAADVKIYYLTRDPWTKLSEIKVYEDGTLESLPDTEKLITHLF